MVRVVFSGDAVCGPLITCARNHLLQGRLGELGSVLQVWLPDRQRGRCGAWSHTHLKVVRMQYGAMGENSGS